MGNLRNLFYSSLLSGVVVGALNVILPLYLSEDFNTSLTTMGLVFSTYALLFALMQVPSSYFGDRFRRKTILAFSKLLDGLCLLVYGMGSKVAHFVYGKALEGVSTSISRSPSNALLTELSERHRFSESFGNLIGYFSVGYVLGFFLAGPLVGLLGYRSAILSLLAFQLASLAFILRIRREETPRQIKFNLLKFLHKPDRNLKMLAVTGFAITFVEYMDYTVTVIFLKEAYGASISGIGLVMGLGWLFFGLLQITSGRHSDKLGRKKSYVYGGLLAGAAALSIPHISSLPSFLLLYILLSAGHGVAFPAVRGMIAESTSEKYRSQDFGFVTTFEELGAFVGFPAMGWIADNMGFDAAFQLRGLIILSVTAVVYLTVKEKKKHDETKEKKA